MSDLEQDLRAELGSDHYRFTPEVPVGRVRRRIRRRRALQAGAAAGAVALAVAGVLALVPALGRPGAERPGQPPVASGMTSRKPDPLSTGTPAGLSDAAVLAGLPIRGVPAYLMVAPDAAAAMRTAPALSVQPTGGAQRAFTRGDHQGDVDRLVVVLDHDEPLGLVGTPLTDAWVSASTLGGLQPLATDDAASRTAYLTAFSPTGKRWFIAVTGPDRAARLTVLKSVATATLPGT